MWKENLYQPVEILIRNHDVFPIAEHQHSFFEMAYVKAGSGQFYIKESGYKVQEFTYQAQSLFLIPPETTHCFTISTHSEYVFIRFATHYIENYIGRHLAEAFRSPAPQAAVVLNEPDRTTVSLLIDFICREAECHQKEGSAYLQQQWLNSILVMVARHLMEQLSPQQLPAEETNNSIYMLQYIQQHIHQPELLHAEALGKVFNLSPHYIGHYFKHNFQETIQQYVARNRMKMVENLLLNSHMTIKEIAYKMGYADPCYLVRLFRKQYKMPPQKYRKRYANQSLDKSREKGIDPL